MVPIDRSLQGLSFASTGIIVRSFRIEWHNRYLIIRVSYQIVKIGFNTEPQGIPDIFQQLLSTLSDGGVEYDTTTIYRESIGYLSNLSPAKIHLIFFGSDRSASTVGRPDRCTLRVGKSAHWPSASWIRHASSCNTTGAADSIEGPPGMAQIRRGLVPLGV